MTTPNQPAPDVAFTVGGGPYKAFGQGIGEGQLMRAIMGPMFDHIPTSMQEGIDMFEDLLRLAPIDALRAFQPFLLGTSPADFATKDKAVETIIGCLKLREIAMTVEYFQNWINTVFQPFHDLFMGFWDGLWKILGGLGTGANLKDLLDLLGRLWNFLYNGFTELTNGLWKILGGIGTGQNIKDLLDLFKRVWDFLNGGFTGLIQGLWNLFGGLGNIASVQDLINLFGSLWNNLFNGFWNFVNGIANIFGLGGATHTIQQTLDAVGKWMTTVFQPLGDLVNWVIDQLQKLVDGILNVWKPGSIAGGIQASIADAVNAIGGILGISNAAAAAAANAEMGVDAIRAEQAGGKADEFTYPIAATPPTAVYAIERIAGVNGLGPDGNGRLVWKEPLGLHPNNDVLYRRITNPLLKPDGVVTVVLTKPTARDPLFGTSSCLWICAQWSATDKSRIQVQVNATTVQFQTVSTTGVVTPVGAAITIPQTQPNDKLEFRFTATGLTFARNGIVANPTPVPYTPLAGRCVGFGVGLSAHTNGGSHLAPELAGITWV